jgi:hypothetical protein
VGGAFIMFIWYFSYGVGTDIPQYVYLPLFYLYNPILIARYVVHSGYYVYDPRLATKRFYRCA